jgi:hypothetical protein
MEKQELFNLVKKIKYVENLDLEIERIEASRGKILAEIIKNNDSPDITAKWDFYLPLAIAEKVADMIIEYYVNLRKETEEELATLEVIKKSPLTGKDSPIILKD